MVKFYKNMLEKNLDKATRRFIQEYMQRRKALDFLVEKAKIKEVG